MNVGLFIPCYIDAFFTEVGIATLELLEKLGCAVEYPLQQTCCGQPMANSGCQEDAAATEAHFVECFKPFGTTVGPSASCVHHIRDHLDAVEQTTDVRHVRAHARELPFHSSLCGSYSQVCPVKIDISDQIYKWRRVVASKGLLKIAKKVGMSALGATLAHEKSFRAAETLGEQALEHLPRTLLYNPLNPWGKHHEMPAVPRATFHRRYLENRSKR